MTLFTFPSTHHRYVQHLLEDALRDIHAGKVPEFAENPASTHHRLVVLVQLQPRLAPDDQPFPEGCLPETLRWTITEKVACAHRMTRTFTDSEVRYRCRSCAATAIVDVESEVNLPAIDDA